MLALAREDAKDLAKSNKTVWIRSLTQLSKNESRHSRPLKRFHIESIHMAMISSRIAAHPTKLKTWPCRRGSLRWRRQSPQPSTSTGWQTRWSESQRRPRPPSHEHLRPLNASSSKASSTEWSKASVCYKPMANSSASWNWANTIWSKRKRSRSRSSGRGKSSMSGQSTHLNSTKAKLSFTSNKIQEVAVDNSLAITELSNKIW